MKVDSGLYRQLPAVDELVRDPALGELVSEHGQTAVTDACRVVLSRLREEISAGDLEAGKLPLALLGVAEAVRNELRRSLGYSLRPVINATGVILHTNLGRAPLAEKTLDHIRETAGAYSNLEFNLETGDRGKRDVHVDRLFRKLLSDEDGELRSAGRARAPVPTQADSTQADSTRAEISTIVVNNNAAAVLLALNTLAEGGEVIVSRGELVEIGGSFRIPDVMAKSGAILREVGTTNRTRIEDYKNAINERTRLILRVHPSNYRIIGFTHRPSAEEIADVARSAGVPSFEDLGSGCLIDLSPFGVKDEPVVADSLKAGLSVVSFSGDKMLGGPQAGIIAGSREIVDRVARNPLMRALRVDKMTYAALEATLRLYERGSAQTEVWMDVPVIRAIAASYQEIADRAASLRESIARLTTGRFTIDLEDGASVIGGGSAPEVKLPTVLVTMKAAEMSAASLEERLRGFGIPIITRTEKDRVMIDLRTVSIEEEAVILEALAGLAQPAHESAGSVESLA